MTYIETLICVIFSAHHMSVFNSNRQKLQVTVLPPILKAGTGNNFGQLNNHPRPSSSPSPRPSSSSNPSSSPSPSRQSMHVPQTVQTSHLGSMKPNNNFGFTLCPNTEDQKTIKSCRRVCGFTNKHDPHMSLFYACATDGIISLLMENLPKIAKLISAHFGDMELAGGKDEIMGNFFVRSYEQISHSHRYEGDFKGIPRITQFRMQAIYGLIESRFGQGVKRIETCNGDTFVVYSYTTTTGREELWVPDYYHGKGKWSPHISYGKFDKNPKICEMKSRWYDDHRIADVLTNLIKSASPGPVLQPPSVIKLSESEKIVFSLFLGNVAQRIEFPF